MRNHFIPLFMCLALTACSSPTDDIDLNATRIVEDYLATQTALIPSTSSTSTITPTTTSTPFPPTLESVIKSGLTENSDGSITYANMEFGYEMTFPENWVIIQLSESESAEIFSSIGEEIPEFEDILDLATLFSQGIHMIAYDIDPSHNSQQFFTNLNAISEDFGLGLSLEFVIDTNLQLLPQFLPGAKIINSFVDINPNDVEFGLIIYTMPQPGTDGSVEMQVNSVLFISENNLLTLTLSSDSTLAAEVKGGFENIINLTCPQ